MTIATPTSISDPLFVRVVEKVVLAQDICRLSLVPLESEALPKFSAGAHIDVCVPGGFVRQYSLCNSPHDENRYVIAVQRDPASRGGSASVHDLVHVGQTLSISKPRNHFELPQEAAELVLFAGGIGITPLLSMAEHLHSRNSPFFLHYFTKSLKRTAFAEQIKMAGFAGQVSFHFNQRKNNSFDLTKTLTSASRSAHLCVCGPRGFIDWILDAARLSGWEEWRLHWEFFTGLERSAASNGTFTVVLAKTGARVVVGSNVSVVQALARVGVGVPISCEQGICGFCLTRVISGVPDHRDSVLTAKEQALNNQFTPCCSRSKTAELVIDL